MADPHVGRFCLDSLAESLPAAPSQSAPSIPSSQCDNPSAASQPEPSKSVAVLAKALLDACNGKSEEAMKALNRAIEDAKATTGIDVSANQPTKPKTLLDLPREIRNRIYDMLFLDTPIISVPHGEFSIRLHVGIDTSSAVAPIPTTRQGQRTIESRDKESGNPSFPPIWLQTCSQIFDEGVAQLHLRAMSWSGPHPRIRYSRPDWVARLRVARLRNQEESTAIGMGPADKPSTILLSSPSVTHFTLTFTSEDARTILSKHPRGISHRIIPKTLHIMKSLKRCLMRSKTLKTLQVQCYLDSAGWFREHIDGNKITFCQLKVFKGLPIDKFEFALIVPPLLSRHYPGWKYQDIHPSLSPAVFNLGNMIMKSKGGAYTVGKDPMIAVGLFRKPDYGDDDRLNNEAKDVALKIMAAIDRDEAYQIPKRLRNLVPKSRVPKRARSDTDSSDTD